MKRFDTWRIVGNQRTLDALLRSVRLPDPPPMREDWHVRTMAAVRVGVDTAADGEPASWMSGIGFSRRLAASAVLVLLLALGLRVGLRDAARLDGGIDELPDGRVAIEMGEVACDNWDVGVLLSRSFDLLEHVARMPQRVAAGIESGYEFQAEGLRADLADVAGFLRLATEG